MSDGPKTDLGRTATILGIDAGLAATGYGLIDVIGKVTTVRGYGVFRTSPRLLLPDRLALLFKDLQALVSKERPDEIAIEDGFFGKNVRSALVMGQTRGLALLVAALAGIQVFLYPPREVKLSLTGNGSASKDQVAFMVKTLLKLKHEKISKDTTDALAVAMCRSRRRRFDAKVKR